MRALLRRPVVLTLLALLPGCAAQMRRFPLRPPVWQDLDRNDVPVKPAPFFSGLVSDAVDKIFLRPLSRALIVALPREARNVNALDEVPDSSWFHNRIGLVPMSPEEAARGACTGPPLAVDRGPWLITTAKTEGVTPGFFAQAPDGRRYLMKVDGFFHPQRASAADVVVARIYHAAGYPAPCNSVGYFRRDLLVRAANARARDARGRETPLTEAHVDAILEKAVRLPDGRLRLLCSELLPGAPLGPYPVEGVREDDPNDAIPHEDRRELRGMKLLAAWVGHFDIREENSLDMWVAEGGRHFVRHYQLDFGDSFGAPWDDDRLARRAEHAYYVDLGQMFVDFVSLGLVPRPWYRSEVALGADIFGYFGIRDFVPSRWKPIYPNPSFGRMRPNDALWMVRILVRFSDAHIRALVKTGRLTDPIAETYLVRTLIERRDRIAREYLTRYVPLDRVRLVGPASRQRLCFEDLAIRHAGVAPERVVYRVRLVGGAHLEWELGERQLRPDPAHPDRRCFPLPVGRVRPADLAPPGARADDPLRYGVLEISVQQRPSQRPTILAVHLYDLGPQRGFVLVGIERPPHPL